MEGSDIKTDLPALVELLPHLKGAVQPDVTSLNRKPVPLLTGRNQKGASHLTGSNTESPILQGQRVVVFL